MADDLLLPEGGASFPVTNWSVIRGVQGADPERATAALNRLIERYWKPVFYYVRACGRSFHQAQDLTQEFFTRLIERDWLRLADPNRGRFRSFLLVVLKRFLADQSPARVRSQVRFEGSLVSVGQLLTDEDRSFEPAAMETPETVYLKQWAAHLLSTVMADLKRLCAAEGRSEWFDLFVAARLEDDPQTQLALAARFGLSRDALRHRVGVLEKRVARLLRAEIRDQVDSDAEVDQELADLQEWLGRQ